MKRVTIKDVAKHAGVSVATVSRVINKTDYVSPENEEVVLKAIQDLSYYPDTIARSLKVNSTKTIGFLVSDISNNYFTVMAKAVEDVISKENYNLIVCSTDNMREREAAYLKLLMGKKVDGLIINTTGENRQLVTDISRRIPVVKVSRKINESKFRGDFVDSNNFQGAYMLTSHLLSLGHRKIFALNGSLKVSTGQERFNGFKQAMREEGIEVNEDYPYKYEGDFKVATGYLGMQTLFGLKGKPTAVVIMNNMMAIGALKYVRINKIKVPQDLSIASYENIENIELMAIQPSVVKINSWEIGNRVGETMLERIKSPHISNKEIIFQPELQIGNAVQENRE